jgi:tyrosine-protein kinase Etk/Wzc
MSDQTTEKKPVLSDYLYILYKWKKFILINLFAVGILSIIIVLIIPNDYKSTATIMIPPESNMGLGGLTSLLGGKSSIASMGSKLFGVSNTSEDVLLGIINSRTALEKIVNKFELFEYYDIDDENWDKVLRAFTGDISADPNEYGMIEFSVINEDPETAAEMANYMVVVIDSLNIKYNIERAKNSRQFIEKRYLQNVNDLKNAEDSLYAFQKKYGIVAVPEQLEVTVKVAAELEAELIKKEMASYFIKQQYGENSPQYLGLMEEVNQLRNKVQELKSSTSLGSTSNILFSFDQMPNIAIKYLRAFREVEIQQSILEIVLPMYEQAKVEEQKSTPTVMVVDKAVPAQLKYSPKRSVIVILIFFLAFFVHIVFVFRAEKIYNSSKLTNPLLLKENKFYLKVIKFYKIVFPDK